MRRTKRIIASLVAAVTVISQVMPMMKVTAATDNVRLATFNIAANKKPDITKLNELLKTNNVDIVGLQEVDINTSRNPYNMLEKFMLTVHFKKQLKLVVVIMVLHYCQT